MDGWMDEILTLGENAFKNRLDLRLYTQSQVQLINFCLVILSWFQWKWTAEYFQESVKHPESTHELIKNMSRRVELRPEPGKRQQEKFTFLCRVITSTNTQDSIQLHHWRRSDTSLWGILHLPIVDTTTHTHTDRKAKYYVRSAAVTNEADGKGAPASWITHYTITLEKW